MNRKDETTLAGVACHCKELCSNCSCKTSTDPLKNQSDHRTRIAAAISRFYDRQGGAFPHPSLKNLDAEVATYLALRFAGGANDE